MWGVRGGDDLIQISAHLEGGRKLSCKPVHLGIICPSIFLTRTSVKKKKWVKETCCIL